MKCSAETSGPVGDKSHKDWCDLHGSWTFDCLLKLWRQIESRDVLISKLRLDVKRLEQNFKKLYEQKR